MGHEVSLFTLLYVATAVLSASPLDPDIFKPSLDTVGARDRN
jgi:hypothetical protein